MRGKQCVVFLMWAALTCGMATAQVTTGTILGTVTDATGAVLADASITIRNVETGVSRTLRTDTAGRYRAPQLALGTYEVQAESPGFQRMVRSGITLTVGREALVDFTLPVGTVAETVTVTGEAPLVEATTSSVSQVMQGETIREIPLNGRSFDELALLQPGVFLTRDSQTSTSYGQTNRYISMGGSRANANVVLLDGTNINAFWNRGGGGAAGQQLGVDAIREFRLITSSYSAEYGRSAGGVMNVVTRSGTNDFHGSAFEFLRNSALDARRFTDFLLKDPPPFKRNQFGATLGGPILRDRTFFFGAWEGLRERTSTSARNFVPTDAARAGILPTGGVTVNSAIRPYLALYPAPNGPDQNDGTAEYNYISRQTGDEDFFQVRGDHQLSASHSIFARYTLDDTDTFDSGSLSLYPLTGHTRNQYLTLQHTALLSATLLNTARFGFNRSYASGDTGTEPAILRFGGIPAIGQFTVTGLASHGYGTTETPYEIVHNLFEYSDDVLLTKGAHSLKFGGLLARIRDKYEHYYQISGQYTFRNLSDFLRNVTSSVRVGLPGSNPVAHWRQLLYGFYLQDDYRVTGRLTLNLGLRYEFVTNTINTNVGNNAMVPTVPDPLRDTDLSWAKHPFRDNPSLRNLSPRLGFAWDPLGSGKMAVRGGFGIVYEPIIQHYYTFNMTDPPASKILFQNRPTFPNVLDGIPQLRPSDFGVAESISYHYCCSPRLMQYSLTVQRELPAQIAIMAGYVGSKGTHLQYGANVNVPWTQRDASGRYYVPRLPDGSVPPRRNPNLGPVALDFSGGTSLYNAFELNVQKRTTYGLSAALSYTFSKNIDTWSGLRSRETGQGGPEVIQNPDCLACERSLSDYDQRHTLSTTYMYELPVGGNRAVSLSGLTDKLLGGWRVGGSLRAGSGLPFSPLVTFDHLGNFGETGQAYLHLRPDVKPGFGDRILVTDPTWSGQGFLQYFDPNAFVLQPAGYFGNLGRNALIGPGNVTWDFSLMKKTAIAEGKELQFRAEFFNFLNRVNLERRPNTTVFNAATGVPFARGGQIRGVLEPRKIQFGLKLEF